MILPARIEAVPAFWTPRDPTRETLGHRPAKLAKALGTPLMPWQAEATDVIYELDPVTGQLWYREFVIIVPRQNGKSLMVRVHGLDTCLFNSGVMVRYTAQNRLEALGRLERDFYAPVAASPLSLFLDGRVGNRRKMPGFLAKTGSERIQFVNNSWLAIASVKAESGHGPTLQKALIDEAFAHEDARVEQAARPAMITVKGAQLGVISAAGTWDSKYLWQKRELAIERANAGVKTRTAFFEFSAPPDADRADPATWAACMPAVGHTIDLANVQADFDGMSATPEEFDRAYLGWWQRPKREEPPISVVGWNDATITDDSLQVWTGIPTWSIDTSPDREFTSIALAADSLEPGRVYLELVHRDRGTDWVLGAIANLAGELGGERVVIDATGAAASLIAELKAGGFQVVEMGSRAKARACGWMHDAVLGKKVAHLPDPEVVTAFENAGKHRFGDSWILVRGKSLEDVSPLYALLFAGFVHMSDRVEDYDATESIF